MKLLLDTHAWVWSLTGSERLSRAARQALEQADAVFDDLVGSGKLPERCW